MRSATYRVRSIGRAMPATPSPNAAAPTAVATSSVVRRMSLRDGYRTPAATSDAGTVAARARAAARSMASVTAVAFTMTAPRPMPGKVKKLLAWPGCLTL